MLPLFTRGITPNPLARLTRRDLLRFAGIGSVVLVSGFLPAGRLFGDDPPTAVQDFFFLQLSDTHLGFSGPKVNPDPLGTLPRAIAAVNALPVQPDFIVFTGDLTHTTPDAGERRARMQKFQAAVAQLKNQNIRYLPGEHDAAEDQGQIYRELFGPTHYSFDHKGVHFIALDNVSDPGAILGQEQLAWLEKDLKDLSRDTRIVVFTHRPLFDLFPQWDWSTRDAQAAIDLLMPFTQVTVFYGHIHQEHHHTTGHIQHHAAHGLMFSLPAPGSVPKKAPIPWDAAHPYAGLGSREVELDSTKVLPGVVELPLSAP
jgi:hypothetical protein